MKKLLLLFLLLPLVAISQTIYVPDDALEAYLETPSTQCCAPGTPNDNYVNFYNVNASMSFNIPTATTDLTGIQSIPGIFSLGINSPGITDVDVSMLPNLHTFNGGSYLEFLNIANGNNCNFQSFVGAASICNEVDGVIYGCCQNNSCIGACVSGAFFAQYMCGYNVSTHCATDIGCTEPLAYNYDPTVSIDTGGCIYFKTYVPDDNFEQELINLGLDNILDDSVNTYQIVSVTELCSGNWFFGSSYGGLSNLNISDLTGIEDFTALTALNVSGNPITTLDVSNNLNLNHINCSNTQIISLDLSNNPALSHMTFENNPVLSSLDISNGTNAANNSAATGGGVYYLTISNNPQLFCITVDSNSVNYYNSITTVQPYNFAGTWWTSSDQFSADCNSEIFGCMQPLSYNYDSTAAFENGTCNYFKTYIPDNNFENALITFGYDTYPLDDSVNTYQINTITNLGGWNSQLQMNVTLSNRNISDLTGIEDFTSLEVLNCDNTPSNPWYPGNQITNLDVSQNTALTTLFCNGNPLTSLDLSNNPALVHLSCQNSQITSLDLSNNPSLSTLYCENNQLQSLDISSNPAIGSITCYNNQLTSLEIGANTNIDLLWCEDNQLTTLDLSANNNLSNLRCSNNQLVSLNIKNGNNQAMANWGDFSCTNNAELYCIEVDDISWANANLTSIDSWNEFSNDCATDLGCLEPLSFNYDSIATIDNRNCLGYITGVI